MGKTCNSMADSCQCMTKTTTIKKKKKKESACNVGAWVRSLGLEDPLKKGRATHSSILAWRNQWSSQSKSIDCVDHNKLWKTLKE